MEAPTSDLAHQPTAWARIAARLVSWAAAEGVDRAALLQAARLSDETLADLDARIPLASMYALLERAAEALDEPLLGLRFTRSLTIEDLDALGFLMITSPTLRHVLERATRYQHVFNDGERFEVELATDVAHVRYVPYGPSRPAHHLMAQLMFGDFVVNGGAIVGGLTGATVRLRADGDPDAHARAFGVPVELRAPIDEVVVPLEVLERPLPDASPLLNRYFERWAEDVLRRLPGATLTERVERLLTELLPAGSAGVEAVALRIGASPRTLQRRLAGEGASFKEILDAVRRRQALLLLERGAAIAEVAWMLGYSEPSAFHRAFRRWTGRTPEAWRATP
ncbi:MAG: AraC family transcriptional regulator [Myxococcales bacterium]|nr:AraC family transcriptional regulator [Myxococcales bacterium]